MIQLPKKDKEGKQYISYSQISTWKKNKRNYIRRYFFDEKFLGNAYTEFGKKVGEALENNDFSGFSKEQKITLKKATRLDLFEREIKWEFDEFYVVGYIDTVDKELTTLIDYKTGDIKTKISEYNTDDYTQLDIYCGAILQETGKMPKKAFVELIDRKGNGFKNEELVVGDTIENIPKKITLKRLKEVEKEVVDIVNEISDYYKVFLKLKEGY